MDTEIQNSSTKKTGAVLVVGGGIGGIQAALDLADSGYYVYLVEESPAIGGVMASLDKTFPTNDCSMCILSPKLVECGRHLNIEILSYSELLDLEGSPGDFTARIKRRARFVDPDRCTGCGECAEVCPVTVPNEFEEEMVNRKAIFRPYPQAVPNIFAIDKIAKAPCRDACPAGINVQGYVALLSQGKYKEALALIRENLPLPGVIGRICPHPCESACNRAKLDEAVAICDLKRFLADKVGDEFESPAIVDKKDEKVAVVGSGPGGLSCAYFLALRGYRVTIFEALPVVGGMLRVGIPDYRLPPDILENEIDIIKELGVEIKTNSPIGDDRTIDGLLEEGYKAVFIAAGSHMNIPLGIPGEDCEGVVSGVELLRKINLGQEVTVGKRAAIIGGGDVAIDAARSALRMGAQEVSIVYRRSRKEMPASDEEIEAALQEGINIQFLAAPVGIRAEDGRVVSLGCVKMELGAPDSSGRRRPVPIEGSEFFLDVDMVIPAIGQASDLSFLDEVKGLKKSPKETVLVDPLTFATDREGVFAGGDCVTGPWIAIEAIAAGKRAAISIERFLSQEDLADGRGDEDLLATDTDHDLFMQKPKAPRLETTSLAPEMRKTDFREVEAGFTEEEARQEADRCLNCGICSECMQCVAVCKAEAVDHQMTEKIEEIKVGSVILSPGFDEFEPDHDHHSRHGYSTLISQYGYGRHPNVVTSIEFERILSASGPYEGHLLRPSDRRPPKNIAWIQCVGSRDVSCDRGYCSSVCCMYAIKEAVIAKEHSPTPLDVSIFFMDMRTYGKDFDKYYERAKKEHGIEFVRSKVFGVEEVDGTGNLSLRYSAENGELCRDDFDMVVLSVGLKPRPGSVELANRLGVELNEYDFCRTHGFAPVNTSREGVYVCGAFQGPKDIPETVMQASGAAAASSALLSEARGELVARKEFPPETVVTGEPPRIGVFVCHCGINIGGIVNVPEVKEYAASLPNVVFVDENLYTCSQDTQENIKEKIAEYRLNRVVVASCSPRTHEPLFQETLQEQGLNKYLFEMANIRDQCSWVHQNQPEPATQKAKDLVRMAVAKARLSEPLRLISLKSTPSALVIGGGIAGMVSALNLADQGFEVHLVEKAMNLGGMAKKIHYTLEGLDVQAYIKELVEKVTNHPLIQVYLRSAVVDASGYIGNFTTTVKAGTKKEIKEINHGVAVIATGGEEHKTAEYFYKKNRRVLSLLELEKEVAKPTKRIKDCENLVMIQCVGSRDEDNPYCSKVCCSESIKCALMLKDMKPEMNIYVLYRDIRTYGFKEDFYRKAREKGIIFIHYEPEAKPEVTPVKEGGKDFLKISVDEPLLGEKLTIDADLLALAIATTPPSVNKDLSQLFKVPLNEDGFFLEAHMKLRPVEFATDGVFMCGLAHGPKFIEECIAQAQAAASRAGAVLSREIVQLPGTISFINQNKCVGCGECASICPFGAIEVDPEQNKAVVNDALCKGCGACAASCKSGAINLYGFTNSQILTMIDSF
ncbi:MAG: NAD(P)-binding protein [Thermodesulfobacteriota bacterium]|nr:NAD(P)-binding protein [Thermodesulfobacteriota bacterium]